MMGKNHALSGLAAGLLVAAQLGYRDVSAALPFAVVVAGYALAPDLDCSESTASRFLGWLSELLSSVLETLSAVAFRLTATSADTRSCGTHRHLTHTITFALVAGCAAEVTGALSPWVVLGWIVFGVLAAGAAISEWLLPILAAGVLAPVITEHLTPMSVLAPMQHWTGLAVGLGCLVHILGDAITVSGVPMLWPIRVSGQAWHELHLLPCGLRLHTGLLFEKWIIHPAMIGACISASALVWPGLAEATRHLVTGVIDS